jgi:pilus assembly protein CpaB
VGEQDRRGVNQKREVAVIMQDVVVLATGVNVVNNIPRTFELDAGSKNVNQISLNGSTNYTTLTIEATPKEAQDLIYIQATASGSIYFTLRNPNDRAVQPRLPSSTSDSVLGKPAITYESPPAMQTPIPMPMQTVQHPKAPQQVPKKKAGGFRDL